MRRPRAGGGLTSSGATPAASWRGSSRSASIVASCRSRLSRGGAPSRRSCAWRLSGGQAESLRRQGIDLDTKTVAGQTAAQRATAEAADGHEVYKKYSGPSGLKAEFEQTARDNPLITKLVNYGKTVTGRTSSR